MFPFATTLVPKNPTAKAVGVCQIDLSVNAEGYIIGWNKDDVLDYITNYDED